MQEVLPSAFYSLAIGQRELTLPSWFEAAFRQGIESGTPYNVEHLSAEISPCAGHSVNGGKATRPDAS